MKFWKMNGAGNDFIIINNMEEKIPHERLPEIVRTLCRRRFSIGADGFIVVDRPEKGGDYRMIFFNSDGSMSEMCGNGARCICRYGFETGLAGQTQRVEATAGLVTGRRVSEREYRIRLNDPTTMLFDIEAGALGKTWRCDYVELGDPGLSHIALELPDLRDWNEKDLFALGKALRWSKAFPKYPNVNFFVIEGENKLWERTWEVGVEDFTYACGTGSGSVVAALTKKGRLNGKDVHVYVTGGLLRIDVEKDGLFLTGPTNIVAKGEVFDEDLVL